MNGQEQKAPFVSITLVCYNYAHLLSRALEAIGRQTFRDFEVIFIDNGGTDNSMQVAKEFFAAHPDIRATLLRNDDPDHSNAFGENLAVAHATGEYLLFHDADDWMDDNCLELLAAEALRTQADRVICSFRDVNDDGKVLQTQRVSPEKYRSKWNYGMQQGNLFRRSLYVESGIKTVDSVFLDTIKTFAFNRVARRIGFVEPICYNYLVHTDSTSRNKELHHGMWEVPRKTFGVMLNEMFATYTALTEEEDRLRAEQQMTKSYYSYMLQFLRKAPFREMKESYRKLHAMMREKFPRYLKNPYLTLRKKYGNRFYARLATVLPVFCERTHLMIPALWCYHMISKLIYIPV